MAPKSDLEGLSAIKVILFWDFLMFEQIFLSRLVKRSMIISDKHGIFKLPHELPDSLRLMVLGNYEVSRRFQNFSSLPPKIKILSVLAKSPEK